MLKWVQVSNFVKFEDKQTLRFSNGLNVFVGENDSGKSCLLEGIRRCLSIKSSTTLSKAFCDDKISYVACKFDDVRSKDGETHEIFSCCLRKPQNGYYYKVAARKSQKDTTWEFGCDQITYGREKTPNIEVVLECDKSRLEADLPTDTETNAENFVRTLLGLRLEPSRQGNKDTKCEDLLTMLNDLVVSTFASRAIGPLQWSLSEKVSNECRDDNYKQTVEKAEIIQWFLKNGSSEEIEKEKRLFSIITAQSKYQFALDKEWKTSASFVMDEAQQTKVEIPMLKLPEGILEAKNCSVLMAVNGFQTLCLEEPDKGMHPLMIARLRDELMKVENKVVIITTHQATFINHQSARRLFHFSRDANGRSANIHCINDVMFRNKDDMTKLVLSRRFPDLFLSKRFLFVEGKDDFLLMTAVLQQMHKEERWRELAIRMKAVQVIEMMGSGEAPKLYMSCSALQHKAFFILDNDVLKDEGFKKFIMQTESSAMSDVINCAADSFIKSLEDKIKDIKTTRNETEKEKITKAIFETQKKISECHKSIQKEGQTQEKKIKNGLYECAKKLNMFIWKLGAIETVVFENDKPEQLEKQYKVRSGRKKLFSNKDVTFEDINALAQYLLKDTAKEEGRKKEDFYRMLTALEIWASPEDNDQRA